MNKYQSQIPSLVTPTIALLTKEYPNAPQIQMQGPLDHVSPKALHPCFYGCYDWHSAVHSHWQLIRAMRLFPDVAFVQPAIETINETLTAENVAVEMAYFVDYPRFEMPYGMAWLLQLCLELRDWQSDQAQQWLSVLQPLEAHAAQQFRRYCEKLSYPVRTGLHSQTAFALGFAYDWAKVAEDIDLTTLIATTAKRLYLNDVTAPLAYEPSGTDFLSPSLAAADLLQRVLPKPEFAQWLDAYLPDGIATLQPIGKHGDVSDGQLAHLVGLNFSRAWMLRNIGEALPSDHTLRAELLQSAEDHIEIGWPMAMHGDYMVSHWVPSFAVYALGLI